MALYKNQFELGRNMSDVNVLCSIAAEFGLSSDEIRTYLLSNKVCHSCLPLVC